jgi:hypothetical protein
VVSNQPVSRQMDRPYTPLTLDENLSLFVPVHSSADAWTVVRVKQGLIFEQAPAKHPPKH